MRRPSCRVTGRWRPAVDKKTVTLDIDHPFLLKGGSRLDAEAQLDDVKRIAHLLWMLHDASSIEEPSGSMTESLCFIANRLEDVHRDLQSLVFGKESSHDA